jgi:hypothetical protein
MCNEEWVTNRKLGGEERESLETAVTMKELKESMEKSNFESTSGWNGISFKVIRHFWDLLSYPMLKMVNETFLRGELMDSFKLGLIKLIPKKGKAEKVGDWRPITLLCYGYKLISGIVAKRLEKYLMKIIGRSQKGFLKQKSIHTCTANIMTCISQAWIEQEECGVMCVDFKKAFDSVEHAAIKMILEFFNFGETMVGMVMTLLNSRISRVIVEDRYSDSLGITRGTPQGDRSSSYIFIIVIEILLIKMKGMDGHGIESCDFIRRKIEGMNLESITAEAYADDLTAIFKMSNGTVELILWILNNFTMVSGLEVNTDKTQLMIVGTENWPVGNQIGGITIVDKVKVLGVGIDRRLGQLENNWYEAITRMRRLSGYWCNFGMSITGRVMVAKTYLVSQVVYLMGVLPMSKEIGDIMNDILITFISGRNRPIERRRQLLGVECGGYGMMDMNIMNVCVKSTWIRRVKDMERDGLDYIGALIGRRGVVSYDQMGGDVDAGSLGIIGKDILLKWYEYKREYYMMGNNILEAYLFDNKGVFEENDTVNNVVFNQGRYLGIRDNLRGIKVRRMLDVQNRVRSKIEVEAIFNVGITWVEYFRLRTVLQKRIDARRDNGEAGRNVELLMDKGKIKSSKLRKKIMGIDSNEYLDNDPRTIPALRTLWGGGELMKKKGDMLS